MTPLQIMELFSAGSVFLVGAFIGAGIVGVLWWIERWLDAKCIAQASEQPRQPVKLAGKRYYIVPAVIYAGMVAAVNVVNEAQRRRQQQLGDDDAPRGMVG